MKDLLKIKNNKLSNFHYQLSTDIQKNQIEFTGKLVDSEQLIMDSFAVVLCYRFNEKYYF